jgi:hypothetical protein
MPSVGQYSEAPGPRAKVHGRRFRGAEATAEAERTLEGVNTRRATASTGFRPAEASTLQ